MTTPRIPSFRQNGTVIDLANVRPEDIDFAEMASGLPKIARFNGAYRCEAYSVAQHSILGADAIFRETTDRRLAGCFLLHDGHEYLLGDWTRPAIAALDFWMTPKSVIDAVKRAAELAKAHIDNAIYTAAGIKSYLQMRPSNSERIRQMDERMLRAEGLALFGEQAAPWLPAADLPPPRLIEAIEPWPAAQAEANFIDRLERYLDIRAVIDRRVTLDRGVAK